MSNVAKALGLADDSSEDEIIAALKDFMENAESIEEFEKNILTEMEAMEARYKAEIDELQQKLDSLEKERQEEEQARKDEQCKNMLEGFVKIGRIKNEAVAGWIETVKLMGLDKVKNMIEELPLNKKAHTIQFDEIPVTDELPTTALNYMAKIKAKNMKK